LLRYSEVLLLAAEAYNKATPNLDAQARIELNKVRKELADVSPTLSGTALFDAIANEKF
jgi:hypothetical protein